MEGYGIPLGSALSSALAPLFWVPFLQEIKKNDAYKFIVFADDILIMATQQNSLNNAYYALQQFVQDNGMRLGLAKVQNGKLGQESLRFVVGTLEGVM